MMKVFSARVFALMGVLLLLGQTMPMKSQTKSPYEWAVIGAGPAGIVVMGLLLDLGIAPSQIAWIDPEFNVGRLSLYGEVPANSTVGSFLNFLKACRTFSAMHLPSLDRLFAYQLNQEPPLQFFVDPLLDITRCLCQQVATYQGNLTQLDYREDTWEAVVGGITIPALRVVLATGSHPSSLQYPCDEIIPLDNALNKSQLALIVKPEDSIAVVGSSHSAVLVMKFLSELSVARIINFYNKPLQYAADMGTWVLHNSTGLKGVAAEWARNVLEKNLVPHLIRIFNTDAALKAWLPICNKIVYAIGYERNQTPAINGSLQDLLYDPTTGVIAPRLFGIGIAFPERQVDPFGNVEFQVGLSSFMAYAQRVVPEWVLKEVQMRFRPCEDLFNIVVL